MATAIWFAAHNYTPADPNSIQAVVPVDGTYTDLNTGDMCLVYNEGQTDILRYDSTSSATQNIPHVVTSDGNAGNGRWLKMEFSQDRRNGFDTQIGPQSDSLATIGVVGTTFTLTYVADYSFFVQGAKYTVTSGNKTVEITDVHGLHWIYFDNTGTLQIQAPGGSIDDLILENCLVAAAYWDATSNACIRLFDERHGSDMSPVTHYHAHETFGARYETGLGLSGFSVDGTGDDAVDGQFDIETGEFHDEDNEIVIAAEANATIDTMYRLGVGGPWFVASASAGFPVADGSIDLRLDWNDYNGGTWQRQEVPNNDYVLCHYFATNDVLGNGVIGIMGQDTYGNIFAARTGAEDELASLLTGDLPMPEILPIASVIFQTSDGYTNQIAARIRSTSGGFDYIDWRQVTITATGATVGDHESLSGLLGGAAADHYHLTGTQHTDLTDGGDTTLHDHDGISENTAARHTQNTDSKIEVANSKVEVVDAGAGQITLTADNGSKLDVNASGVRMGGANIRVTTILDEDDMASDSATALATQQSIKAYIDDYPSRNNVIINGDFNIWQRGTSWAAIANDTYTADRWRYAKTGTVVHTVQRVTDTPTESESDHESNYSFQVRVTTADASMTTTDLTAITQFIEGYNFQNLWGRECTLSFWVKATKTGIYSVAFKSSSSDSCWVSEYTVNSTDTWEKKTVTITFDDTIGTWAFLNGRGLEISFCLSSGPSRETSTLDQWQAGSSYASDNQVNSSDAIDNYWYLSQVKFEVAPSATKFVNRPIQQELALCQRYYQMYGLHTRLSGYAHSSTFAQGTMNLLVEMRSAPTIDFGTDANWRVYRTTSSSVVTTMATVRALVQNITISATVASGLTAGQGVMLVVNSSGAYLALDAEL